MPKKKTKKLESKTEAEVYAFMKHWGITDYGTAKCLFEQDKRITELERKK